jgi:hypothetical protein
LHPKGHLDWEMGTMTERRAARRYDLSLPAVIRLASGDNGIQQQGKTRNVSTRGVYLVLDQPVSKDTEFTLNMVLPTEISGTVSVFVRAIARVIRLEEWTNDRSHRVGVAAAIRRYEIVRSQPSPSSSRSL